MTTTFETPAPAPTRSSRPASGASPRRLMSLDAYRGFIMLAMLSGGFGFLEIAHRFPSNAAWAFLASQFNHALWAGCKFWDLIQPSFMFMVGVAIPFSYANRVARGETYGRIYAHAVVRSVVFVVLGLAGILMVRRLVMFAVPYPVPIQTTHILVQIGLTYGLAYPFVRCRPRTQLLAAVAIYLAHYAAYLLWPAPGPGIWAHFEKGTNLGAAWDRWLVDLSPTDWLDRVHVLGLTSLNFVPGVSTVLTGMLVGTLLRGPRAPEQKTAILLRIGAVCFIVGLLLSRTICPMVKLLWTLSFAVYSTAWTLWFLAAFHWLIDVKGWRRWSVPFVAVGVNSIVVFLLYFIVDWWIGKAWTMALGRSLFESTYGPLWSSLAVLVTLWAIAAVLYWRRIFIRL